jgi:alpha/beta superfamily hydrolase
MTPLRQRRLLAGPDGSIEVFVEHPCAAPPQGIGLVAHPHPLMGGTADNKVVTTLSRTLQGLGYVALRPQFRGVGASEGEHDQGGAETDDLHAVLDHAREDFGRSLPVVLAGFSFGAYVMTRLAARLAAQGAPAKRLILVGTAAGHVEGARHYDTSAVPPDSLIIHGACDDVVPLENVLAWAQPLDLAVCVIPGADHFFHRRLTLIRRIIEQAWRP